MSTILNRPSVTSPTERSSKPIDELHSGDRMTREEFHCLYEQTPKHFKAELIGGIVYVASPLSRRHGRSHSLMNYVLVTYEGRTPGVETLDNTTTFLAEDSEPQPDLSLRVKPDHGGQSQNSADDDYVVGAPELVIEVAHSSKSIDLHAKRNDYARHVVKEYVVWIVKDGIFFWFDLRENVERPLRPENIIESFMFPGLWLDGPAVLAENHARLTATLEAGLATPEHAAFVKRLAEAKK